MSNKPAHIAPDQFAEILRVVRETIRAEMRAERDAKRDEQARYGQHLRDYAMKANGSLSLTQYQAFAATAAFNRDGLDL